MNSRPFQRILFFGGILIAVIGVYFASQSSSNFDWTSVVAIVITGVGAFAAIVGLFSIITVRRDVAPEQELEESVLPAQMIPFVYGGFLTAIGVIAGLTVAHWAGRNAGLMTFIFAFVIANLVFGVGLALGRTPSYR